MKIRYIGLNNHSVMYDKEYEFLGSDKNINNQFKTYDVPDTVGAFLIKRFKENSRNTAMTGIVFKEVKKK